MKISTRLLLSAACASLLFAGSVQAQQTPKNYWFLKAIPQFKPKGTAAPAQPAITLSAGVLPDGMEGKAYSFDLKTFTQVTAGPGIASAQYAVGGGNLPAGISLSNDGMLAGTPTALTAPEGASFQVVGTYVTATGQQAYTIKVGESVLQVVQVSAGATHTCAITTTGAAKCWGNNSNGRLGNGTTTSSNVPVQVTGLLSGVSSIFSGQFHTCAIADSAARCWGANSSGQLGNGTSTESTVPVQVTGLTSGVSSISADGSFSCAVHNGAAKCWGDNGYGNIGDGTYSNTSVPVQVTGLTSGISSISSGPYHACSISTAGEARCWGSNNFGQLGEGTTTDAMVPVQVTGMTSGVSSIDAGDYHTCVIVSGTAKCSGRNNVGQLGDGTTTNSSIPVQVTGLTAGVTGISANGENACAIISGSARCWGNNANGQLGDGTATNSSVPVQVTGLTAGVSSISSRQFHACAVVAGAAKCWGANFGGQLGNNTRTNSSVPVTVKAGN